MICNYGQCCRCSAHIGFSFSQFQFPPQMERQWLQSDTHTPCADTVFFLHRVLWICIKKKKHQLLVLHSFISMRAIVCRIETVFNWNVCIKVAMPTRDAPTLLIATRAKNKQRVDYTKGSETLADYNGSNSVAICRPAIRCWSTSGDQLIQARSTPHAIAIVSSTRKSRQQFRLRTGPNLVCRSITMSSENRKKSNTTLAKRFIHRFVYVKKCSEVGRVRTNEFRVLQSEATEKSMATNGSGQPIVNRTQRSQHKKIELNYNNKIYIFLEVRSLHLHNM